MERVTTWDKAKEKEERKMHVSYNVVFPTRVISQGEQGLDLSKVSRDGTELPS